MRNGEQPKILSESLISSLNSKKAYEKNKAAIKLCDMEGKAAFATQELAHALTEENCYLSYNVVIALGNIGCKAAIALPMLSKILKQKDENEYLRRVVAEALGKIMPEFFPDLEAELSKQELKAHPDSTIVSQYMAATEAIIALMEAVKDKDRHIKLCAIKTLGQIAEKTEKKFWSIVKSLQKALNRETDQKIRQILLTILQGLVEKSCL